MAVTSLSYVKKIDTIEMFAGDTLTFDFEFYFDDAGLNPIDLLAAGATAKWSICPYGQYDYPALVKEMNISHTQPHHASVTLTIDDTINMKDIKYSHQPFVEYTNSEGRREYRRLEGDLIIKPMIKHS